MELCQFRWIQQCFLLLMVFVIVNEFVSEQQLFRQFEALKASTTATLDLSHLLPSLNTNEVPNENNNNKEKNNRRSIDVTTDNGEDDEEEKEKEKQRQLRKQQEEQERKKKEEQEWKKWEAQEKERQLEEQRLDVIFTKMHNNFKPKNDNAPIIAVFYNIFLPYGIDEIVNASQIIHEQLGQLGDSYAAQTVGAATHATKIPKKNKKGLPPSYNLVVYYKTIGNADAIPTSVIESICQMNQLHCIHLGHHEQGYEEVTLGPLHQFCSRAEAADTTNPNKKRKLATSIVLYMHSKGTYHSTERNRNFRYHMTRAVSGQECISSIVKPTPEQYYIPAAPRDEREEQLQKRIHVGLHPRKCNACGLLFMPIKTMFFLGNMWTASCDYVQSLHHPMQFQYTMNRTVSMVKDSCRDGRLQCNLYPSPKAITKTRGNLTVNRYYNEQWIGSHPDISPCDVSPVPDITVWWKTPPNNITTPFEWKMGPRTIIHARWFRLNHTKLRILVNMTATPLEVSDREFFLLPGFLWKWWHWHKKFPKMSSWVWDWFPRGAKYREMIRKRGTGTLGPLDALFDDGDLTFDITMKKPM